MSDRRSRGQESSLTNCRQENFPVVRTKLCGNIITWQMIYIQTWLIQRKFACACFFFFFFSSSAACFIFMHLSEVKESALCSNTNTSSNPTQDWIRRLLMMPKMSKVSVRAAYQILFTSLFVRFRQQNCLRACFHSPSILPNLHHLCTFSPRLPPLLPS